MIASPLSVGRLVAIAGRSTPLISPNTKNAATMLAHSKNVFQAEIDAVCELVDFLRFNAYFMQQIYDIQPASAPGIWDRLDHRPLEGFVFAVTPFNFTSIGGNLPTAPAIMGNTVIWKPASTAVASNYFVFRALEKAGLPPGVLNVVWGIPGEVSDYLIRSPVVRKVSFTGSVAVGKQLAARKELAMYLGAPPYDVEDARRLVASGLLALALPATAQQTGAISGRVTATDGSRGCVAALLEHRFGCPDMHCSQLPQKTLRHAIT